MPAFSINETATCAKLAARGAGYSWGMAEEVARSIFWLSERSLPGCEQLSLLLRKQQSKAVHTPRFVDGRLTTSDEQLCPFTTGCAIADLSFTAEDLVSVASLPISHPLLIVPSIADVAARLSLQVTVVFDNANVTTDGKAVTFSKKEDIEVPSAVLRQIITTGNGIKTSESDCIMFHADAGRAEVDNAVWDALQTFAHKTYAPNTGQSRLSGAGAGLLDND